MAWSSSTRRGFHCRSPAKHDRRQTGQQPVVPLVRALRHKSDPALVNVTPPPPVVEKESAVAAELHRHSGRLI
ncbi:MAG: hypothetical protein NTZ40_10360 [Cyanobacteria bacterium]|nr:hypothetical protein [Cyanobacteriota bacterium]